MSTWKKTYIILALCLIGAGIIYLMLPLSDGGTSEESTGASQEKTVIQLPPEQGNGDEGSILYRIEENRIETAAGWQPLAGEVTWIANGERMESGQSRFLGQTISLSRDDSGNVIQVSVRQDLSAPMHIRVLLTGSGGSQSHARVSVSCEEAFWAVVDGEVRAYAPGAEVGGEILERRAVFYPSQAGSALSLTTPKGTTAYYGSLEITREEDGSYTAVNEVELQTYLKGVVPAEMPGSYGTEAARVQAVCARSYAFCQWSASERYLAVGAQVDDGVGSQVYGGAAWYADSSQGVEDTCGQILTWQGTPISANYFSTSCGYTANGQEVWSGAALPYLQGQPQYEEGEYGDLSQEENFHEFITGDCASAYDSESPWFRWTSVMNREQLQEQVQQYFVSPQAVRAVEGQQLTEKVLTADQIGTVEDLYVYERSETGMALSLLLLGSEESVVLEGPSAIRQLLGGLSVTLANGEDSGARSLLPSAFISLEKIKDTDEKLVSVKICGGGYGHGVGMSQNGVRGMITAGYDYRQILAHYFPGTELIVY